MTERISAAPDLAEGPMGTPLDAALARRLEAIAAMEPTIDLAKRDHFVAEEGWHLDAREAALQGEAPGEPEHNGPFATACDNLRRYAFPPPSLIRGTFDPAAPLDNRAMLLTATYLWMTFELPVRVSRVIDAARDGDRGPERVWGYSYQTLAGHLERGEITFEIVKHLASGGVTFRIHSFSQTGHIGNLIHRIGFRIVGRRLQRRFAQESLRNMQVLVATAMLEQGRA